MVWSCAVLCCRCRLNNMPPHFTLLRALCLTYLPTCLPPPHCNTHHLLHTNTGDIEDGVPSAHCCGAVSLLYYGIHAATAAGLLSPQHRAWAQAAAAVWVVWLAWGRAYLGLHSPLDLATGTLLGWALLRLWVSVEQPYAAWLEGAVQQHQPWWWLSLHVLAASAVLMRCYPMPSRWTSCYNYATAWAAGWAGATVGWGILQQAQLVTTISGEQEWLLGGLVPPLACKIFLGLGMVAASKVIVKALLMAVFTPLFAVVPLRVRCAWQPPVVGTVKQPLQQEQSSAQRLSGYASALLHKQQDGGVDAAAKQGGPSSSSSGNNSSSSKGAKAGGGSSKPVAAALSGLRHTPEGVGNDVVAAARWFSYFAVGLTVSLWQAMWPVVINTLAPPRAFAA